MSVHLFKPRDFIYINQSKLDSYFSQLYGGLIQNIDVSDVEETQKDRKNHIEAEAAGKFGLGKGSVKLLDFLMSQLGNVDLSGKLKISRDSTKLKKDTSTFTSNKTLEHFQYALFEESMKNLGYLINLNEFHKKNPRIQAGQIRENLNSSDFVMFKASQVSVSDYRNAAEFIRLFKRIMELMAKYKLGELIDQNEIIDDPLSEEELEKLSVSSLVGLFNDGQFSLGSGEKFNAIVNGIDEFFNGQMIPHDILLKSEFNVGNLGKVTFESQLKDSYLLEERTDLSYKYGFYDDADWMIVGQITSTRSVEQFNFQKVFEESAKKITEVFSRANTLNVNSAVKDVVKEIDQLTKKLGLLPLVDEQNISLTPIAIFREPNGNSFFK